VATVTATATAKENNVQTGSCNGLFSDPMECSRDYTVAHCGSVEGIDVSNICRVLCNNCISDQSDASTDNDRAGDDDTDGEDTGGNVGLVIGVLVGVIGFFVAIVAVFIKCRTPESIDGSPPTAAVHTNQMYDNGVGNEGAYQDLGTSLVDNTAYIEVESEDASYLQISTVAAGSASPADDITYDAVLGALELEDDDNIEC